MNFKKIPVNPGHPRHPGIYKHLVNEVQSRHPGIYKHLVNEVQSRHPGIYKLLVNEVNLEIVNVRDLLHMARSNNKITVPTARS